MSRFHSMLAIMTITIIFGCGSETPSAPDVESPTGTYVLQRIDGTGLPTGVTTRVHGPVTIVGDTLVFSGNGTFAITSVAITGTPVFTIVGSTQVRADSIFLFEGQGGTLTGRGLVLGNVIEVRSEGSHPFPGHLLEYHRSQ